jgi:multidrug transporter EmrE-like cation transporter
VTRFPLVAFSVLVNAMSVGLQIVASPFVLLGLFAYGASVGVWLLVLSRVEAGYAYPMLSVGYIVNAVAGYYPFQENLSVTRVAGILVIVLGVYLVSRS